jgi:hypothetical protein
LRAVVRSGRCAHTRRHISCELAAMPVTALRSRLGPRTTAIVSPTRRFPAPASC